ncbi:hypothetical protein MOA99_16815 [Bacillus haynesii]|uniref:hypothetical protein n=1 Tax=Bacillus haynesii TaxID=1925021 RepID=UPI00227E8A69|nr:hypothetical protein [Bacillus haynesii]MCY7850273.1 hypothetical protein [Bacillus haynesii]
MNFASILIERTDFKGWGRVAFKKRLVRFYLGKQTDLAINAGLLQKVNLFLLPQQ